MYSVLNDKSISNESLINIVHFIIGVLIKYKSIDSVDIDIDTLKTAPTDLDLKIAHEFLDEIHVNSLIDNDIELDRHIQNLYELLKERMETSLNTSKTNGLELLKKMRSM
ncbi:hypothetical protein V4T56_004189 [Vibrio vulnificus]|nr:hypothetical protein [Vibrio vulnificus]EIY9463290.1 hypothetical protein [Vibrio vulnificus]EIZ1354364.1 hypothetical protein [Vibrio vulnificus]